MPLLSVSTLGPLTAGTDALFHCHWMQLLIRHSVAWALRDGEDVEVISTWPGAGSRTLDNLYELKWSLTNYIRHHAQGPKHHPLREQCDPLGLPDRRHGWHHLWRQVTPR